MDFQMDIPPELVPLFIGAIALVVGTFLVDTANLVVKLIGLVVSLGGVSFMLVAIPNGWVSSGIKTIIVILVFIGLSAKLARTGWSKSRAATIIGAIFTLLGVLALISQLSDYGSLPDGTVQDLIEEGLNALSRIFKLSSETID